MKNEFSFERWWLLVRKHWTENRKKYILSLIAIAGVQVVWYLLVILSDSYDPMDEGMQGGTYFVGLFIIGCFYASTLFSELASRPKGINYLLVPASHLEKLLVALFYAVLLFFVVYTLVFYLVDIPFVKIANQVAYENWKASQQAMAVRDPTYLIRQFEPEPVINIFKTRRFMEDGGDNIFALLLKVFFAVQSAYLLASIYFSRFGFVKVTVVLLLLGLFMSLLMGQVLIHILPEGEFGESLSIFEVYDAEPGIKRVMLPGWIGETASFLLEYAFAPMFWIVTCFRLKEKQI